MKHPRLEVIEANFESEIIDIGISVIMHIDDLISIDYQQFMKYSIQRSQYLLFPRNSHLSNEIYFQLSKEDFPERRTQ